MQTYQHVQTLLSSWVTYSALKMQLLIGKQQTASSELLQIVKWLPFHPQCQRFDMQNKGYTDSHQSRFALLQAKMANLNFSAKAEHSGIQNLRQGGLDRTEVQPSSKQLTHIINKHRFAFQALSPWCAQPLNDSVLPWITSRPFLVPVGFFIFHWLWRS